MRKTVFLIALTTCIVAQSYSFNTDSINAKVLGKIIFESIPNENYKPRSIILKKNWPISEQEFVEYKLDSSNYNFSINLELDQISEYTLYINFFPNSTVENTEFLIINNPNNNPSGFFKNNQPKFSIYKFNNLILEPSDSLNITIDFCNLGKFKHPSHTISGTGSRNTNFFLVAKVIDYYSEEYLNLTIEEKLNAENKALIKDLMILENSRNQISANYYEVIKTDLIFSRLSNKHRAIQSYLYRYASDDITQKAESRKLYTFMDSVEFNISYLNSPKFRAFLYHYLEYIKPLRYDLNSYELEQGINLSNITYNQEIQKYILFQEIKKGLESSFLWSKALPYYHSFIEEFPNSVESKLLTKEFNKHIQVSEGKTAPNLILTDSLGKKTSLNKLRGKVVLIYPDQARSDDILEILKKLRKQHNSKEFVLISLKHSSEEREPLNWSLFDYYPNNEQNAQNIQAYLFNRGGFYFVVGKDGTIHPLIAFDFYSNFNIDRFFNEEYNIKTRIINFSKINASLMLFTISFLILALIGLVIINRQKILKKNQFQKQLNSELKAIRSQLNPHFLFNSLNSIQSFINNNSTEEANLHLSKFARLMRQTLDLSNQNSISLHEEISFIKDYLELEQVRYGFIFEMQIDENIDLYNTEIPSLITQPFVENAIIHGMANLGVNGILKIDVNENENTIVFSITDNGKGLQNNSNEGFGLKGCRDRIDLVNSINKNKISLEIESPVFENRFGTKIILTIPEYY